MDTRKVEKHLYYGTLLSVLVLGSLASVVRSDLEAKIVSAVCSTILFSIAALAYFRGQRALR